MVGRGCELAFKVEDRVNWRYKPRGSYGFSVPEAAVVVRVDLSGVQVLVARFLAGKWQLTRFVHRNTRGGFPICPRKSVLLWANRLLRYYGTFLVVYVRSKYLDRVGEWCPVYGVRPQLNDGKFAVGYLRVWPGDVERGEALALVAELDAVT
jgi:hypothetical protein